MLVMMEFNLSARPAGQTPMAKDITAGIQILECKMSFTSIAPCSSDLRYCTNFLQYGSARYSSNTKPRANQPRGGC